MARKDTYIGVHFDFHARDDDRTVGALLTPDVVNRVIDRVRPDYIECDGKGHHGISSYATKVGTPAPGLVGDPLRVWRTVTAERRIPLYVHYSTLLDTRAIELHPEWARVDEHGVADDTVLSIFSSYLDELMLPQLTELIVDYGVDGFWIDGDTWGLKPDFSDAARQAFTRATGISEIPRRSSDPAWSRYLSFQREQHDRFLARYVAALHSCRPGVQVGVAWAYSTFQPDKVRADVDYLSGDSAPMNGSFARLEGRFFAGQDRPWDLMTWSFAGSFGLDGAPPAIATKSVVQLQQEAATIIVLGGGYQTVSNQKLDATIVEWTLDTLGAVTDFCRARQDVCHRTTPVKQIGLLHSATAFYAQAALMHNSIGELEGLRGILQSLVESQYSVGIIPEHALTELADYPLVVVPEWRGLPARTVDALHRYVVGGGSLLVIGAEAVGPFLAALDVEAADTAAASTFWIAGGNRLAGHVAPRLAVDVGQRARSIGVVFGENDTTGTAAIAATVARHGSGSIAGIYFDYGQYFIGARTSATRDFLSSVVRELLPDPAVQVTGSRQVEVVLVTKGDTTIVHLVNLAGAQDDRSVWVFDEIPCIGPLEVILACSRAPGSVTLEPEGSAADHVFVDGMLRIVVPRVEVHCAVVVRPDAPTAG